MRDLRLSANGKMGVVQKDPKLNHRTGDFRAGLQMQAAGGTGNFVLISRHNKHVREVRRGLTSSTVSGGIKTLAAGVQTAIKCTGKKVIVTTYRDGTLQVAEELE